MRNKSSDLNNLLFAQLERLSEEEMKDEELEREIKRAKGISDIASRIIENGDLALKAHKQMGDTSSPKLIPELLKE